MEGSGGHEGAAAWAAAHLGNGEAVLKVGALGGGVTDGQVVLAVPIVVRAWVVAAVLDDVGQRLSADVLLARQQQAGIALPQIEAQAGVLLRSLTGGGSWMWGYLWLPDVGGTTKTLSTAAAGHLVTSASRARHVHAAVRVEARQKTAGARHQLLQCWCLRVCRLCVLHNLLALGHGVWCAPVCSAGAKRSDCSRGRRQRWWAAGGPRRRRQGARIRPVAALRCSVPAMLHPVVAINAFRKRIIALRIIALRASPRALRFLVRRPAGLEIN